MIVYLNNILIFTQTLEEYYKVPKDIIYHSLEYDGVICYIKEHHQRFKYLNNLYSG